MPRSHSYTAAVSNGPMLDGNPAAGGLSIVLPARNEVANIVSAVENALVVAQRLTSRYEVIVVDDGSSDGTGQAVEALAQREYPQVRLVTHPVNQGYGAALRTGFREAHFALVFFTDSDNQFDLSELESLLPLMTDHDIVTGFRVNRHDPFIRSVYSWFYNRLVNGLFGLQVRDVNCAFKLMRRESLQRITIECDNFFVNTELLAKARHLHLRIAEMGVRHYPRTAGVTTVRLSDIPRTLGTAVAMWRRIHFPTWGAANSPHTDELRGPNVSEFIPVRH